MTRRGNTCGNSLAWLSLPLQIYLDILRWLKYRFSPTFSYRLPSGPPPKENHYNDRLDMTTWLQQERLVVLNAYGHAHNLKDGSLIEPPKACKVPEKVTLMLV